LELHFHKRLSSSSSKSGRKADPNLQEKSMGEQVKPVAIFGLGLYLGLMFFKDDTGKPREGSKFLKNLKDDFYRSNGSSENADPPK